MTPLTLDHTASDRRLRDSVPFRNRRSDVTLVRRLLKLQQARGRSCSGRGHVQPSDDATTLFDRRHHVDAVALHPGVHVGRGHGDLIRPGTGTVALEAGRRAGGGGGAAARVRRRRGHRALAAQVPVGPRAAAQAAQPPEPVAELGRHQVVQDRVQGGVDVHHDPAEEQQQVEVLDADQLHDVVVGRRQDDPQDERAERQQAQEERRDHRAQHEHHLPAVPERRSVRVGRHDPGVGHQVPGDDHVQYGQHGQRHHEEHRYGADEEQHGPHGGRLGPAHRHQRAVHVLLPMVVGQPQHRAESKTTRTAQHISVTQMESCRHDGVVTMFFVMSSLCV